MTDFRFTIGMSTKSVISKLNQIPDLNENSKQLIINFCNNDKDKKISNEIELAMLNSWMAGSEKIKMPTEKGMKQITSEEAIKLGVVFDKDENARYYQGSRNSIFGTYNRNGAEIAYSSHYPDTADTFIVDELRDIDKDGYADFRITSTMREPEDKSDYHKIDTTYADYDLDGEYDNKEVIDFKVNGYIHTEVITLTDLHTNDVSISKSKYNMRTGEEID